MKKPNFMSQLIVFVIVGSLRHNDVVGLRHNDFDLIVNGF